MARRGFVETTNRRGGQEPQPNRDAPLQGPSSTNWVWKDTLAEIKCTATLKQRGHPSGGQEAVWRTEAQVTHVGSCRLTFLHVQKGFGSAQSVSVF